MAVRFYGRVKNRLQLRIIGIQAFVHSRCADPSDVKISNHTARSLAVHAKISERIRFHGKEFRPARFCFQQNYIGRRQAGKMDFLSLQDLIEYYADLALTGALKRKPDQTCKIISHVESRKCIFPENGFLRRKAAAL